jgi:hypothetical protein
VTGVNSHVQTDQGGALECASPTGVCRSYARNLWSPYFNVDVINKWFEYRVP